MIAWYRVSPKINKAYINFFVKINTKTYFGFFVFIYRKSLLKFDLGFYFQVRFYFPGNTVCCNNVYSDVHVNKINS